MIYRTLITLVTLTITLVVGQSIPTCSSDLPTLSVGKENLIETIEQWDTFVQDHPLFLLGMSDSGCAPQCCESESILQIMN